MTEKINGIDVSECPYKDDDKCFETPILNEYGDLIDYQDCEPQTLCPYRSKIKIQRLQEENKRLQELTCPTCGEKLLNPTGAELYDKILDYKQALEEIRDIIDLPKYTCKEFLYIRGKINEVLK